MEPRVSPANLDYYTAMLWTWSVDFFPHLVTAILIAIVGYVVAVWIAQTVRRIVSRTERIDVTVQPIIAAAVRYAILILVIVAALGQLGVQTASLLAVLGAAGLAIGLALQGTLSNIAAGIMLLWLRPFQVGDYIEVPANNLAGVVTAVGLFASTLENAEGLFVFAPNGVVWNTALRNHTRNDGRLIGYTLKLKPDANAESARQTLIQLFEQDTRIQKVPAPIAFIDSYDAASGASLSCVFRAVRGHERELQREMVATLVHKLQESGVGAPQQVIRTQPPDSDPSRFLLS